jgi:hypothetical protein
MSGTRSSSGGSGRGEVTCSRAISRRPSIRGSVVTADEPIWAGGPEEFPPSFANFQEHRERYLEARRISSERYCAELSLREALSGVDSLVLLDKLGSLVRAR